MLGSRNKPQGDSPLSLRVRPGKKGLELCLHDLEAAIMDVVWSRDFVTFAVSDVLTVLEKKREIAYTTVMTTVARLSDKGVLSRKREGKKYVYSPKYSREEFLESTAREVLNCASSGHGAQGALAMLADKVSEASRTELDELEALIAQRRQELKDALSVGKKA